MMEEKLLLVGAVALVPPARTGPRASAFGPMLKMSLLEISEHYTAGKVNLCPGYEK